MEIKNKIYRVQFGWKDAINFSSVNVLAANAKDAIKRAEVGKQSNWFVASVELLATAEI